MVFARHSLQPINMFGDGVKSLFACAILPMVTCTEARETRDNMLLATDRMSAHKEMRRT
jgi:hypothetical protein